MATIGYTLNNPETGWLRIDDNNTYIKYIGGWNRVNYAGYNNYNGTWIESYGAGDYIEIYAKTTRFRFIGYSGGGVDISGFDLYIDDTLYGTYSCVYSKISCVLCCDISNLSNTIHKFRVVVKDKAYISSSGITRILFDCIDIDDTGFVTDSYKKIIYYLIKDNKIYLPCSKYYDVLLNEFVQLDISTIKNELGAVTSDAISIFKPFTKDGNTYNPLNIIDVSKCKIGAMSSLNISKLKYIYTPSDTALAKTNIKIKDKYLITQDGIRYGMHLDITATDKTKIDYFLDYGQAKSYKSSSILNKEMISDSFYANFKLNKPDSLLSSVTLYNKYYYKKLQESKMDVYDNFKDSAFVVFHDDYDLMLVNRIAKKELINYIETIDKF